MVPLSQVELSGEGEKTPQAFDKSTRSRLKGLLVRLDSDLKVVWEVRQAARDSLHFQEVAVTDKGRITVLARRRGDGRPWVYWFDGRKGKVRKRVRLK